MSDTSNEPTPAQSGRRLGPRSLSGRLVLGVVTLVVVLVLATGAGTYFALSSFLYERLDQQLRSTTNQDTLNALFRLDPSQLTEPAVQAPQHVWAVELGLDGRVLKYPPGISVKPLQ